MHEYSITCSIIKILNRIVKEKKIENLNQVDFEINEFSCIEPDSINFYYEFLARDNEVLRDAKLHFKKISPVMKCNSCGAVFKFSSSCTRCPECGKKDIDYRNIDDIRIVAVHTE